MFKVKTVVMKVKGSFPNQFIAIMSLYMMYTYGDDSNNRKNHYRLSMLASGRRLLTSTSSFKNVGLLLLKI
jgi:hypothetical protein